MADERKESGEGAFGRFHSRARERIRRAREEARRRGAFVYRETGGGYAGYGGRGDRHEYRPEEGRWGAGYSAYGAREEHPAWPGAGRPGSYFDARGGAPLPPWRDEQARARRREAEPPPRAWEGSEIERDAAWYQGRHDRLGGTGERSADFYGGPAQRERGGAEWYGGGVHEARPDRPAPGFGEQGGPRHGAYGRELPRGRYRARGFGGPLGRYADRSAREQGPLYGGRYRGEEDRIPIRGEAIAGRGHVGGDDYRDLERWGEGGAGRGARERYRERRREREHFRG